MLRSSARHLLRSVGQKYPQLRRFSGKLGLGRLVAPSNSFEQITIDGDVTVEFDMSVPIYRHIYFHHDLTASPEVQIMQAVLRPDQTCIDVGAHIGYFCLVAAKYSRRVIAFEPSPNTYKMLKRNLELNPALAAKIRAMECGLSDHAGSLTLYNSKTQPDLASLEPINVADGYTQEITLSTLDGCVTDEDGPVAFIKIDVEGAELDVLKGSANTLKANRPMIMLELIESHQQRFGRTCADVVNFFTQRDYIPYLVTDTSPRLRQFNLQELNATEVNNALFVSAHEMQKVLALTRR